MSRLNPSYIKRKPSGIYILQVRTPKHIRCAYPDIKSIHRKSLHTRDRQEALRRARLEVVRLEQSSFGALGSSSMKLKIGDVGVEANHADLKDISFTHYDESDYQKARQEFTSLRTNGNVEQLVAYLSDIPPRFRTRLVEEARQLKEAEELLIHQQEAKEDIPLSVLLEKWIEDKARRAKASSVGNTLRLERCSNG